MCLIFRQFRLRSPGPETATDTANCIRHIASLEGVWPGAKRTRLILEELIENSRVSQSQKKRTYSAFGRDDSLFNDFILGQEAFGDLW